MIALASITADEIAILHAISVMNADQLREAADRFEASPDFVGGSGLAMAQLLRARAAASATSKSN